MATLIRKALNAIYPSESRKLEKTYEDTSHRLNEAHRRVREACKIDMGDGRNVRLRENEWNDNGAGVSTFLEEITEVICMVAKFEGGSKVPIHFHQDNEEVFLIIDGYLIETNSKQKIGAGEFLIVPKDTQHGFEAPEGALARVILKDK